VSTSCDPRSQAGVIGFATNEGLDPAKYPAQHILVFGGNKQVVPGATVSYPGVHPLVSEFKEQMSQLNRDHKTDNRTFLSDRRKYLARMAMRLPPRR
jgi:hypothetical protein